MFGNGAWKITSEGGFRKGLKKHGRDVEVRKALAACVEALSAEEDPARLGDRKYGRYEGLYGYPLSRSIRVLYRVDYGTHQVILVSIGDHKEVYGRD